MKFNFDKDTTYILPVQRKELSYSVLGYIGTEGLEYIDNKAYIERDTGKIFICSKNKPPEHRDVPIMKVDESGEITYIEPASPQTRDDFMIKNVYKLDLADVVQTSAKAKFFDEKVLDELNSSQEVYRPKIKPEDDPLKKVIKAAINSKGVDLNAYKSKVPEKPYIVSNIKHCIEGGAKVSILNLVRFCELFGLDFEIVLKDNKSDKLGKLNKTIVYSSKTDSIDY